MTEEPVKKVEKKEAVAPAQGTQTAERAAPAPAQPRGQASARARGTDGGDAPRAATPARDDRGPRRGGDDRVETTSARDEKDDRPWFDPGRLFDAATKPKPAHEVREDGTEITRRDGRTTTRKPDGSVTSEYREGDRAITQRTYRRDGAEVREREVRHDNGNVTTTSEVQKGGKTVRTVSRTTHSDQDIEELNPELRGSSAVDSDLARDGQRDGTEITRVTRTVTDTSRNPPRSREVLNRTTYKQHIPLGERSPDDVGISDDTRRVTTGYHRGGRLTDDVQDGITNVDRQQSGQTIAYSVTKETDGQGEVHTTRETGSTRVVTGQGEDGRAMTISEGRSQVEVDGKVQEVETRELRGILEKDGEGPSFDRVGDVGDKDEYGDRLAEGPVNYRHTEVYNVGEDGERHLERRAQEYGDYDNPEDPGRSVTIVDDDDRRSWTYRQVDDTDAGVRVRSQTGVEGSEGYVLTDGTFNDDGTYESDTGFYDNDGVKIRSEYRERVQVADPNEALSEEGLYFGDKRYADRFLEDNAGKPVYRESVRIVDAENDFAGTFKVQRFTAEGSDQSLTNVFQTGQGTNTTIYEDPGSDTPSRLRVDGGAEFSVTRDGKAWTTVDGQRFQIPNAEVPGEAGDEGASNPLGPLSTGSDSTRYLYASLKRFQDSAQDAADFGELHPKANGALGAAGVAVGGLSIVTGIAEGDIGSVLSGGSTTVGGLADLSSLGSKAVNGSRLSSALGTGGKVLGVGGAILGAAYGGYQISQGDTVGGLFSLTAAGGTGLAVGATIAGSTGWVPVAGWITAGVAVAGGFIYDLWRRDQEEHKTKELQF